MLKTKVIAVQENEFEDKYQEGKKVKMNKVTVVLEEGIAELWTTKPIQKGQEIELTIGVGKNYKPVVKIA